MSGWFDMNSIKLPWCLSTLPIATSFILLGRYYSKDIKEICRNSYNLITYTAFTIVASFVIIMVLSSMFQLNLHKNHVTPTIILIWCALVGCFFLLSISNVICMPKIENSLVARWLSYTGKNTFVFVGLSQVIIKVQNLFYKEDVLLKYFVLFVLLYGFIWVKNNVKILNRLHL